MAAATWCYRGDPEEEQPALLVTFSNGRLQRPDAVRFSLYRSSDVANPRKKRRRILVSETERLSYVGNNFSSGAMKCNSLCRYFLGVLNKDSGQMEVFNAEIFNMQPLLSDNAIPDDTRDYQNKSYREKVDLCIEAFGTSKQKRALNSRRMNAVGNDILNTAVTKAAADVIDAKGVTALIQDVAQDDDQNMSIFLPPCHEDADKPENVYKFEDILSPAEYEALQNPAAAFVNITPEEITKKTEEKSHCSFVLEELKFLPADEKSRDRKARCLWFLDILIKFSFLKIIKKKHPMGPECPHIISRKLMKNFTSLTYNNGSVQNLISASLKTKIAAYVIALALHIKNFQIDLTVLQNDLKLHESRMMDIARAMRLKVSKAKGMPGLENDQNHKLGTLSLPLPVQKASGSQRKRRKIN
ncbi:DNA-directed RNA polymerase I subunit RPA49 [Lagopus muta]|uniref:DNA-directed RNA polymerase I subunit RPA49 n=1 Tax=Lagopus leucura TaxID=30410 RepID=UPI001C6831AE|nr:DNA-directed RNA polymerase I subunit RPA49 [Lagopus leucura]XP_048787780.1 DNA-directed RNA polymerase I subunit RPA49 [Lagopus muta]